MAKRLLVVALMLLGLLALTAGAEARPLAQATATYTPIPTRTQVAASKAETTVTVSGEPLLIQKSVTYGDVYVVTALGVLAAGLALAWAYSWVKAHIKVSE